uniref:ATP-dependent RNA helicase n=1 Tax=Acrobeloides nanus TaxID=290746 RepID=A0A914C2R5_9BILA
MSGLQINEPARPRGVFNKARKQPQSIAQSNNVPNPTQSCVQHEDYNNTLANENLYKDNEEWFTEVYNPPTAPKNPERLINADLSGTQKNVTNYSHTRADIAQEHPIGKAAHPKENENFLVQNRAPKKQVNDFGDCVSASTQMAPNTQAPYEEERQPRQGPRKSKRYIPPRKLEAELFAPENNIEAGPYFDENYSELAIEITGGDGAKLLLDKFDDCKFAPPIMKNIENKKYGKPMPIQQSVIPIILGKHDFDMMGHAQTGSGKTAAYLLPIIDIIYKFKLNTGDGLNMDSPYVLILSPTRELANQLHEDAMAFAVARAGSEQPKRNWNSFGTPE